MRTRRRVSIRVLSTATVAVLALVASGCGSDDGASSSPDAAVSAVATTTQVADFVRAVGGDRVDVHQVLQPNSDPHGYEPRPSDAQALADADVVFRSGGDLDEWLGEVIANVGGDAPTVELIDSVDTIEGDDHDHEGDDDHPNRDDHLDDDADRDDRSGNDRDDHADDDHRDDDADDHPDRDDHRDDDEGDHADADDDHDVDPHWWQDPRNAIAAVEAIEAALIEADPDGRATYEANARAYVERLRTLDRNVAACIDEIPPAQRRLVTTHDALGYYADRYDIEVVGALIPSLSTAAQPSAGDTQRLVDQIRAEDVKAIFPESSINPKLERAVARETGATVGRALWADALGPEDSDGATYVESIQANTEAIVGGLTGGAKRCRPKA